MLIPIFLAITIGPLPRPVDTGLVPQRVVGLDTHDRSRHGVRTIWANGAQLELLDWGGKGRLLVFLPGYGDSAHIFDDLAPAFTDHFHVVGLTPRGFPPSSAPDSGYTIAQLARDVGSVMD